MKYQHVSVMVMAFFFTACASIGPGTVPRDRFDYNTAISNSWKEQTLLNIVKLRYADMPLFMEVASVVSGYTLESSVNVGADVTLGGHVQEDLLSMGTSGKYTDRPTITYAPITGQKFHKSFMTPIPPWAILFLMQTGWPVDLVFPLTVDAINGYWGQVPAGADFRRGDPEFYRILDLLRKLQLSGAVGMRILKEGDQKKSTILLFYRDDTTAKTLAEINELNTLLGLQHKGKEVGVSYGLKPESSREIAMLTRSIMHIMIGMAKYIDVPSRHVSEGRTLPRLIETGSTGEEIKQLIRIKSGTIKPVDTYTAVKYKKHWFWIDDRDFNSKRAFAFLMILFSLTETGGKEGLPLVTIPTG